MRYEFKYFVQITQLPALRELILPFVNLDAFGEGLPENSYVVRSIYFDTPKLDFYHEKVEGIKHRKKVRLRGYNSEEPTSKTFLEIKRKFEIPIKKYRCPLPFTSAKRLLCEKGNLEELIPDSTHFPEAKDNARRFCYQLYQGGLKAVVLVVYDREAYLGKWDPTIRITFDKYLRSAAFPKIEELYQNQSLRPALKDQFILEVKFNRYFPAWMKPIIAKLGLRRESASKYVITMDTHQMKRHSPQNIMSFNRFN